MTLVVAPEAFEDLASAAGYIAQHNPRAAARLVDRVLEVLEVLRIHHQSRRPLDS